MRPEGQAPLGPFALHIERPIWIGSEVPLTAGPAKRHEVTIDGTGPDGVPILGLRDGFIVFRFDEADTFRGGEVPAYTVPEDRKIPINVMVADDRRLALAYSRFKFMTAFLLCYHTAATHVHGGSGIVQEPVDPTNYFGVSNRDGIWHPYFDLGRQVSAPQKRSVISPKVIADAIDALNKAHLVLGESWSDLVSLTYTACYQYSRHQFESAHLIAWTVVEALQNRLWLDLQASVNSDFGGHTDMNKDRRKLLNGRDFTASIVSQIMSITGRYSDERLREIDHARRIRNDFAHSLVSIDATEAGKAIRLATSMMSDRMGIKVISPLGVSYWI